MLITRRYCQKLLEGCRYSEGGIHAHPWLRDATPAQVQADIRKNRQAFLRLIARDNWANNPFAASWAYIELKDAIEFGRDVSALAAHIPRWALLVQEPPTTTRLPVWFLHDLERLVRRLDENPRLAEKHHIEYYSVLLAAWTLLDERFQQSCRFLRRRWRIRGEPYSWYERMNAWDEEASRLPGGWSRRAGMPPFEPLRKLPERDVGTYSDTEIWDGLGLPIPDYLTDVGGLAHLAGGNEQDPVWRRWAESFLWRLKPLPVSVPYGRLRRWYEHNYLTVFPVNCMGANRVPTASVLGRCVKVRSNEGGIRIAIDSRHVAIGDFPGRLQEQVAAAITTLWSTTYREPPSPQRVVERLRALLEPSDPDTAALEIDDQWWEHVPGAGTDTEPTEEKAKRRAASQRARDAARQRKARRRRSLDLPL